ncbi:hypothetical protein MRX96_032715 [Rhipicephalus microplus]
MTFPFRSPRERLLDQDLDLNRLLARCDESRLSTPVAAERLYERELWGAQAGSHPSSALVALKWPMAFPGHAVARSVALAFVRLEICFNRGGAPAVFFSKLFLEGGHLVPNNSRAVQHIGSAGGTKGASCLADANLALQV